MKDSIRTKLFIGVTGLVLFFVSFSLILNSYFLKPYYLYQKKQMLIKNIKYIDSIYNNNHENISLEIEKIERNYGAHIIIANDTTVVYDSSQRKFEFSSNIKINNLQLPKINIMPPSKEEFNNFDFPKDIKAQPFEISKIQMFSKEDFTTKKYIINTDKDKRLNTSFLYSCSLLNNGDKILLTIPLSEITESSNIANQFLLFTAVLTIIIGIILTLIYSKKFTEPILNLNKIAQNMSKLNFKEKCIIKSKDEIGKLGENINSLSQQLDKAISELKEKNKQLSLDIEKERSIDEMRKEFIANVSHELKTPISLIQGYAEGLKINIVEDEESKSFYCDVIVNESEKMNKLVKNLLNLSLIDSNYCSLDKISFDILEFANKITTTFIPKFNEKNITFRLENNTTTLAYADALMVEQILVNYINNALNHVDDKKEITILIKESMNIIKVSVINSGKAIPDEEQNKIWQSFYKIDKARTRAYGGTGLGLSIVAGIQKLHGNNYGVNNTGSGVEFWFEINAIKK